MTCGNIPPANGLGSAVRTLSLKTAFMELRAWPVPATFPDRGRNKLAGWVDSSGNLWLFGGLGFDSNGSPGYLNDLWEFQP